MKPPTSVSGERSSISSSMNNSYINQKLLNQPIKVKAPQKDESVTLKKVKMSTLLPTFVDEISKETEAMAKAREITQQMAK